MISIKSLFKFVCDKKWHDLAETDDKNIRYCERCQENVHHVGSIKQWLKSTLQKKERTCIAVNIERRNPHDAFERSDPDELMGDVLWPLDYPIRDNVTIERRNRHDDVFDNELRTLGEPADDIGELGFLIDNPFPDSGHKPSSDDPDLGHKPPPDDPYLGHKPPPDDPDLDHKPPSDDPFLGAPCLGQKPTL